MWHHMSRIEDRLTKRLDDTNKRIDDSNVKLTEIDKRLYGIETVLHMKDCCVLKSDQHMKKAE